MLIEDAQLVLAGYGISEGSWLLPYKCQAELSHSPTKSLKRIPPPPPPLPLPLAPG